MGDELGGRAGLPRIAIFVENGVVMKVTANTEVHFIVLDLDRINDEDPVGVAQAAKVLPEFQQAGLSDVERDRLEYRKQARHKLSYLTE